MMMVLAALDGEVAALVAAMAPQLVERRPGVECYRGTTADGRPLIVATTGVGKVMAARAAQWLIDRYRPDQVLMVGMAGALNREYHVGDTVVARDCVQHDLDVTALRRPRGAVPGTDYRFLPADPALFSVVAGFRPAGGRLHVGRVLSGDQFIADRSRADYAYLTEELHGDAVEMEGAAVALVCALNAVAFLLVRTISDTAEGAAGVNLRQAMAHSAANTLALVRHLATVAPAAAAAPAPMLYRARPTVTIAAYQGRRPTIAPDVFIADGARIIGDVTIGAGAGIWYNVVIRADVNYIRIGALTNVQDCAMLHVTHDTHPLVIGERVTIGHAAKLHGCTLADCCFVGIGAVVLDGAVVESEAMVAAGAVVRPGSVVPGGYLVAGVPAVVVRPLRAEERADFAASAERYREYARRSRESLAEEPLP